MARNHDELVALLEAQGPILRKDLSLRLPPALISQGFVEDVLQDVWIAAFRVFDAGQSPKNWTAWLRTVAVNKALDAVKAAATVKRGGKTPILNESASNGGYRKLLDSISAPTRTPSGELSRRELRQAVEMALESLSEDRRFAVIYSKVEGLSHAEIANRIDRPKSTINSLIFNGLRDLRTRLGAAAAFLSGELNRPPDENKKGRAAE